MALMIVLDDETVRHLFRLSRELDRPVDDLAACAVSEAVLDEAKRRGWLSCPACDQQAASANARPQAPGAKRRNSAEDDGPDGPAERK